MNAGDRMRLVEIRQRIKTGAKLSESEMAFCVRMWQEHPGVYPEVEAEIVEWAQELINPLYG